MPSKLYQRSKVLTVYLAHSYEPTTDYDDEDDDVSPNAQRLTPIAHLHFRPALPSRLPERLYQTVRCWAGFAVADLAGVEADHGDHLRGGAG